jgi:hypothetical protein
VALLLINPTKISLTKSGFDHLTIIESPLRLGPGGHEAVQHEQVISVAGWSKLDFAEKDKYKPVLLRLALAGNLE